MKIYCHRDLTVCHICRQVSLNKAKLPTRACQRAKTTPYKQSRVCCTQAFKLYAIGSHSDAAISKWMNQRPAIRKIRGNRLPDNNEMVRDLIRNRVNTRQVRGTQII